jgi:hypothetical protein
VDDDEFHDAVASRLDGADEGAAEAATTAVPAALESRITAGEVTVDGSY